MTLRRARWFTTLFQHPSTAIATCKKRQAHVCRISNCNAALQAFIIENAHTLNTVCSYKLQMVKASMHACTHSHMHMDGLWFSEVPLQCVTLPHVTQHNYHYSTNCLAPQMFRRRVQACVCEIHFWHACGNWSICVRCTPAGRCLQLDTG